MRKIQIVVVCLLLALALVSCGIFMPTHTAKHEGIILPQSSTEEENTLPQTEEELDSFFDAIANEEPGSETVLDELKTGRKDQLLSYLMTSFMNGELETASFQDKSAAMTKWRVWEQMLEGEMIALETETPQEYWEEWCDLALRVYKANGFAFFEEEGYPVSELYIALWLEHNGGKQNAETDPLPDTEEELDQLFEGLAASGQRTNAVLDRLKREKREWLVDYLMMTFLNGRLEGCTYDDGSVGTLQYATWCGFRGDEILESPAVSPEHDWEEWSSYATMLYERNGYDFLVEYDYPMAARYAMLIQNTTDAPVLSVGE